jgi:dimethylhistidine N-methyltransferase
MIEPGSGSSEKVRLLLDEIKPTTYVPMDIAAEFLHHSALKLGAEFPWLNIRAICADFGDHSQIPADLPQGKRLIFYPGSTLGNMEPADALQYLRNLRSWLRAGDGMLVGIDLHKSAALLNAAYNDAQGITAAFNLNVLNNINQLLGANFNTDNFSHHAFYNSAERRIEMHLLSKRDHIVSLNSGAIAFSKDESIHTENSYKYTLQDFSQLASKAGFSSRSHWVDEQQLFSLHYLELPH